MKHKQKIHFCNLSSVFTQISPKNTLPASWRWQNHLQEELPGKGKETCACPGGLRRRTASWRRPDLQRFYRVPPATGSPRPQVSSAKEEKKISGREEIASERKKEICMLLCSNLQSFLNIMHIFIKSQLKCTFDKWKQDTHLYRQHK